MADMSGLSSGVSICSSRLFGFLCGSGVLVTFDQGLLQSLCLLAAAAACRSGVGSMQSPARFCQECAAKGCLPAVPGDRARLGK